MDLFNRKSEGLAFVLNPPLPRAVAKNPTKFHSFIPYLPTKNGGEIQNFENKFKPADLPSHVFSNGCHFVGEETESILAIGIVSHINHYERRNVSY